MRFEEAYGEQRTTVWHGAEGVARPARTMDFKSAASPTRDVVSGHLVCIAHEQSAVGDGGVVPGLA